MEDSLNNLLTNGIANKLNDLTKNWHLESPVLAESSQDKLSTFCQNVHFYNYSLWHEEDEARRKDVSDQTIAQVKRNIDQFNQKRNDTIQRIDEELVHLLSKSCSDLQKGPLNSETPGSMADRISIMSLKIYHMAEIAEMETKNMDLKDSCLQKVAVLKTQQADLESCLKAIIEDVVAGRRHFKVYFQFKMYNDPTLNKAIRVNSSNQ